MKRIHLTLEIIEEGREPAKMVFGSTAMAVDIEGKFYPAEFAMCNAMIQTIKDYCRAQCAQPKPPY